MSALRVQQRVRWEVDPSGRWYIVTLGERAVRIENPEGRQEYAHPDDLTAWEPEA